MFKNCSMYYKIKITDYLSDYMNIREYKTVTFCKVLQEVNLSTSITDYIPLQLNTYFGLSHVLKSYDNFNDFLPIPEKNIAVDNPFKKEVFYKKISKSSYGRTKRLLKEYVQNYSNEWTSFITLTFSEPIYDFKIANKKFNNFITMVRRKFSDFKYIGVPEFHKNGSVHYHILTNLICDSDLIPKRVYKSWKSKSGYFGSYFYDIKYWSYGYSLAKPVVDTNIVAYLLKYIGKFNDIDSDRVWGHKKLLKSNNLKLPTYYKIWEVDNFRSAYCDFVTYLDNKYGAFEWYYYVPKTNQNFFSKEYRDLKLVLDEEDKKYFNEIFSCVSF